MKLLAIGPLPKDDIVTGLGIAFEMAVRGLEGVGCDVAVVDTMPSSRSHVSGRFGLGRAMEIIGVLWSSRREIRNCDVVYFMLSTSTVGVLKDFLLGLLAKAYGKPLVGHLHGGGEAAFYRDAGTLKRLLVRASRRLVSRIIVLGQLLRNEYAYLGPGTDVVVVPNGLPPESEPEDYAPKSLSGGEVVSLLYLSNMMPSKGYLALLDACAVLKTRGVRFRCVFCGAFVDAVIAGEEDNTEEAFREKVKRLGVEREVSYRGVVRGAEKRRVLSDAHIFVLPTAYPWEGQPISIIEAMSWGMPVIASRHKGIPEQVDDRASGILLDDVDANAIADAVMELAANETTYAKYGRCARKSYEDRFTEIAFVRNLREALQPFGKVT